MSGTGERSRFTCWCSFCGKRNDEPDVLVIIAGPASVFICDVCVGHCAEIVVEKRIDLVTRAAS